ncbi:neuraminidase-like domain-containing protein [Photorhabdus luminescens]|uniref:Insecticidal toxin complex protein TccB n=1 Tax=Photorhabdus luminescens subsp. sonorensis TaxID=1173677 RepID=A0A5C4RJK1_PHOLU|nr:neuraminidase-like domain-containing protein [Photorhabdus luminescens]TNH44190.1 hypothetical protein EP164_07065 [Photorhabdus luminescens subsp. sonorensis]
MKNIVSKKLAENVRDGLVSYYLGHISKTANVPDLKTPDDLYQYLLIDNQVSSQVNTSVVAQAISSVQQYINGIMLNMEPGYDYQYEDKVEKWNNVLSQYNIWAGFQQLWNYPENYISPILRQNKTSDFKELEGNLNKGKLSDEIVQEAILNYLNKFEEISNLELMSGYINTTKELAPAQAEYYFIGKMNITPGKYYWRSLNMANRNMQDVINPTAWKEWEKIGIPATGEVIKIRPIVIDGRLHIVWLAHEADNNKQENYYSINLIYRKFNGEWSLPNKLRTFTGDKNKVNSGFELIALMDLRAEPVLVISAIYKTEKSNDNISKEDHHPYSCNLLFNEVPVPLVGDKLLDLYIYQQIKSNPTEDLAQSNMLSAYFGDTYKLVDKPVYQESGSHSGLATGKMTLFAEMGSRKLRLSGNNSLSIGKEIIKSVECNIDLKSKSSEAGKVNISLADGAKENNGKIAVSVSVTINDNGYAAGDYFYIMFNSSQSGYPELNVNFSEWGEKQGNAYHFTKEMEVPLSGLQEAKVFSSEINKSGGKLVASGEGTPKVDIDHSGYREADFCLWNTKGGSDSLLYSKRQLLNGNSIIPTVELDLDEINGSDSSVFLKLGYKKEGEDADLGYNYYEVKLSKTPYPNLLLAYDKKTQAQYLDITELQFKYRSIRLNTLFGKELIARANHSIADVLSWEAQHIKEPPIPGSNENSDSALNGANNIYFWELFFHVPYLVAYQLNASQQYQDAQNWLHYIFNPGVKNKANGSLSYWNCSLLEVFQDSSVQLKGLQDPDAIAYADPVHYKKAIFQMYVQNLIDFGDSFYRFLTNDGLNNAKLRYLQAQQLLGPRPDFDLVSHWLPIELADVTSSKNNKLREFENNIDLDILIDLPATKIGAHTAVDNAIFRVPLNNDLLWYWDILSSRFYNLRHNLTLDGKPLSLPLYATPVDPKNLLTLMANGGSLLAAGSTGILNIPPYRFRALLPSVYHAVDTLSHFGDLLLSAQERKDRAEQEELNQLHLNELAIFAISLQQDAVAIAEKGKEALLKSQQTLQQRIDHYKALYDENISTDETNALNLQGTAKIMSSVEEGMLTAAGAASLIPSIAGTSFGGQRWHMPLVCSAGITRTASLIMQMASDTLSVKAGYNRRREEWEIQYKQAESELEMLKKQLEQQEAQISAANTTLQQSQAQLQKEQDMYQFLTVTRVTKSSLYQWLNDQMMSLYRQAYDAVLSLCLNAQACWQYEMGDFATQFIVQNGWDDNHNGLLVGEKIKLNLLKMESAYLNRNERRLELTKTISLKNLLSGTKKWAEIQSELKTGEGMTFILNEKLFDQDYAGHYLRQITSVSVTLPTLMGPYQDIKATLTQTKSYTLKTPDINGVKYLLSNKEGDNKQIVTNLRASQQIALSSGINDSGTFNLNFGDDRYLPFEGTGAVSDWKLTFPSATTDSIQRDILDNLTDIILHVRYTAKDGGEAFAGQVRELLK